jgi:hypothetical protein
VEDSVLAHALKWHAKLFKKGHLRHGAIPQATEAFEPGALIEDLSKLKLPEALKAVSDCEDPNQLKKWMEQDGRKRVRAAMISRHDVLMAEHPDGASPDPEGEPADDSEDDPDAGHVE